MSKNSPYSVVRSIVDSVVESAIASPLANSALDSVPPVDLAAHSAEDSAADSVVDFAVESVPDIPEASNAAAVESVVESAPDVPETSNAEAVESVVESAAESESDEPAIFTYLSSSSESESESEVDEVVKDFLATNQLSERCSHQIIEDSNALMNCSRQTSEAEFSDCEDDEYEQSTDYAYSPKKYLDGTSDVFYLTPSDISDCDNEYNQQRYFLRSLEKDPEEDLNQNESEEEEDEENDEEKKQKEKESEQEEDEKESEQEEEEKKEEKQKKQKIGCGRNDEFEVLPAPAYKVDWTPPGVTTSMKEVANPIISSFLETITCKMPLKATKIRFKEIPEFHSTNPMIGRLRFLITKKNRKDSKKKEGFHQVFSVLPNVLISENKSLFFFSPNHQWYYLCPGKGEKRRFDYHIPAPFSDRQNINTAWKLNFA